MNGRLLLLAASYEPSLSTIACQATEFANYMAQSGWRVTVLTGRSANSRLRLKQVEKEWRGRVEVVRCGSTQMTLLAAMRAIEHPDVVISMLPGLQTAAAIAIKTLWNVPLVSWVQDRLTDTQVGAGLLRDVRSHVRQQLERVLLGHANHLATISDGVAKNLQAHGLPARRMVSLNNWTNVEAFEAPSRRTEFRARLGVTESDFVLLHAGSMTPGNALENLILAMRLLAGNTQRRVHLALMGDGVTKGSLQTEALSVPNVRFLSAAAMLELPNWLRAADLLVLNQAASVVDAAAPSRLLSYMVAGRPVLAAVNAESEAASLVKRAECGTLVVPESPGKFARAVLEMSERRQTLDAMGRAGASFVKAEYGKAKVLGRFDLFLRRIAGTESAEKGGVGSRGRKAFKATAGS